MTETASDFFAQVFVRHQTRIEEIGGFVPEVTTFDDKFAPVSVSRITNDDPQAAMNTIEMLARGIPCEFMTFAMDAYSAPPRRHNGEPWGDDKDSMGYALQNHTVDADLVKEIMVFMACRRGGMEVYFASVTYERHDDGTFSWDEPKTEPGPYSVMVLFLQVAMTAKHSFDIMPQEIRETLPEEKQWAMAVCVTLLNVMTQVDGVSCAVLLQNPEIPSVMQKVAKASGVMAIVAPMIETPLGTVGLN